MQRFFALESHGTTVRREVLGGATTFAAMAYIIVVNPAILAHAGIDQNASTVATILTACFGSLLMGLYANRPIAVAPYMGENVFIAFSLTFGWQLRLGTVFVAGVLFLLLTLLGARTWLARAISPSMKHSFAAGIGLFLILVGLVNSGLVVAGNPAAPLKIGNLQEGRVLLALAGLAIMAVLLLWNVRGAILIGIVATAALGYSVGLGQLPTAIVAAPWNYGLEKIAFKLDIAGVFEWTFLPVLITLCLVSFLDTLGTLVGVGAAGNMLDQDGNFPAMEKPMLVDSLACIFGAMVGTSTSGAFIESAAGIRAGARTGLAAVVTAMLFAISLFFMPLFTVLQNNQLSYAYAPALIVVGMLMAGAFQKIDTADPTELMPALATIAMMVFTYNIANGLTAGLVVYPLLKVAAGRWREVHPAMAILSVLSAMYMVFGRVH
jgi:adenine/guanine/hypoxanthine permease